MIIFIHFVWEFSRFCNSTQFSYTKTNFFLTVSAILPDLIDLTSSFHLAVACCTPVQNPKHQNSKKCTRGSTLKCPLNASGSSYSAIKTRACGFTSSYRQILPVSFLVRLKRISLWENGFKMILDQNFGCFQGNRQKTRCIKVVTLASTRLALAVSHPNLQISRTAYKQNKQLKNP